MLGRALAHHQRQAGEAGRIGFLDHLAVVVDHRLATGVLPDRELAMLHH